MDNFTISRAAGQGNPRILETLLVDNFNKKNKANALGGATTIFTDGAVGQLEAEFGGGDVAGNGHVLALSYDVSVDGAFAGYLSDLPNLDLRSYQRLTFDVRGLEVGQDLMVGLKDESGYESKVRMADFVQKDSSGEWGKVAIPLAAFSDGLNRKSIGNINIAFENGLVGKGSVFVDNIEFHKGLKALLVDNFEKIQGENTLGRGQRTLLSGLAAVNGKYTKNSPNGVFAISYGGDIGSVDYHADEPFSYAGWATDLGGIDCTQCGELSFRIKGAAGGEAPNIYLSDGSYRWGVDIEKYTRVTTDWKTVTLPLDVFAAYGVDLTRLSELQIMFEWEKMSGTIYIDDVRFGEGPHTVQ